MDPEENITVGSRIPSSDSLATLAILPEITSTLDLYLLQFVTIALAVSCKVTYIYCDMIKKGKNTLINTKCVSETDFERYGQQELF